jgi:hypothetical protein
MQTFMFASLTVGAFATEIPQISLNLDGTAHYASQVHSHSKNAKVNSFARRCQVLTDTPVSCPSPTATAHDHHEGALTSSIVVEACEFVKSSPGANPTKTDKDLGVQANNQLAAEFYNQRGEFVLSYNVKDSSNNAAEELVFAMIMEDTVAPVINPIKDSATIQACLDDSSANRCVAAGFTSASATDNYDKTLTGAKFTYSVNGAAAAAVGNGAGITVDVQAVKTNTVVFVANDWAEIFGQGNVDNKSTKTVTLTVVDTQAPRAYQKQEAQTLFNKVASVAESNSCGATLAGITSINACLAHNMQNVVTGWSKNTATACAGCKGAVCFAAGSNSCTAVEASLQTLECAVAGPATIFAANGAPLASGAYCVDDAESASTAHNANDMLAVKATVSATKYDNMAIGTQTFTYKCADSNGNGGVSTDRKITVVDTTPVDLKITHLGLKTLQRDTTKNYHAHTPVKALETGAFDDPLADLLTIQHSAGYVEDTKYIDGLQLPGTGWTCTDTCAGDLTNKAFTAKRGSKVEWFQAADCTGAVVDKFETLKVGKWSLKYSCGDGYQVETACRNIINEDHAKPIIQILEADFQTYEATKDDNYVDAGATCKDEVDGNISQDVEVSGDVVNLARVGTYQIFYNCKDTAGNEADPATRTVVVEDTVCPSCKFVQNQDLEIEASFPFADNFKADVKCDDALQSDIVPVATTFSKGAKFTGDLTKSVGTYTIEYVATDSVGNTNAGGNNCKQVAGGPAAAQPVGEYTRTITVKDTLKPVIKLALEGKIIKSSAAGASTAQDLSYQQAHPAFPTQDGANVAQTVSSHTWKLPSLMAEETATTSVNGWVMGAVASAVSGLALLGYSLRKQAQPVATSVPV